MANRTYRSATNATRVRELLAYDQVTGVFTWLKSNSNATRVGSVAGSINNAGYRMIKIDGVQYMAHRLAWLHVTGAWPSDEIDHRNGIHDDNRFSNLREATGPQNHRNIRKLATNKSGVLGVCEKAGKWIAQIKHDGKVIHLGSFSTIEQAAEARRSASLGFHGDFAGELRNG